MSVRTPKVGEVWRARTGSVTVKIAVVTPVRVAWVRSFDKEVFSDSIPRFGDLYNPPAEPWENPPTRHVWAAVGADGVLKLPTSHAAAVSALAMSALAVEQGCPAVVWCALVPDLDTLRPVPS